MEKNSNNKILAIVAALAGVAVLLALALHETATTEAAIETQATLAQSSDSVRGTHAVAYVTSAPYRDGLFQGKLARERGEGLHISAGRWPSQLDRSAYMDGYLEGFGGAVDSTSKQVTK